MHRLSVLNRAPLLVDAMWLLLCSLLQIRLTCLPAMLVLCSMWFVLFPLLVSVTSRRLAIIKSLFTPAVPPLVPLTMWMSLPDRFTRRFLFEIPGVRLTVLRAECVSRVGLVLTCLTTMETPCLLVLSRVDSRRTGLIVLVRVLVVASTVARSVLCDATVSPLTSTELFSPGRLFHGVVLCRLRSTAVSPA